MKVNWIISITILFLFTSLLLTACFEPTNHSIQDNKSPAYQAIKETEKTTSHIILSFAANEDEWTIFRPLIAQFERDNPDIAIRLISLNTLLANSSGQSTPQDGTPLQRAVQRADVFPAFLIAHSEQTSSLLLNLRPYMDADAGFASADFFPGVLDRVMKQERMWMLPSSFRISLLSYNKPLLLQKGITPPTPDWTWKDLLTAAEQVSAQNAANGAIRYGLLDPSNGILTLSSILQARGSELQLQSLQQLNLDRPEVVSAVTELLRLQQKGAILLPGHLPPKSPDMPDIQQLVLNGQIGLWPEDMADTNVSAAQQAQLGFEMVTFPAGYNPIAGQVNYGYAVSAGTQYPQAAWKWLTFLSHQQLVDLSSVAPGHIPARRSVAEQYRVWNHLPPHIATVYQATLGRREYAVAAYSDVDPATLDFMQQVLERIFAGEQTIPEVLAAAQEQLTQQLAHAGATPTITQALPVPVDTPPPNAPTDAQTITFLAPPNTIPELIQHAQLFQQQYPDIVINIASTHDLAEAPSGTTLATQSDCFLWRNSPDDALFDDKVIDLQPLIDADATILRNDYPQIVLSLTQRGQRLLGLPFGFRPYNLTYNASLFERNGLAEPKISWKPDDFLATAAALSHNEGAHRIYGYAPLLDPGTDLFFFIRQFGGQLATGSGVDVEPHFTDPKVVAAIRWYLELSTIHNVMPKPKFAYKYNEYFDAQAQNLIQQGYVGMWFTWGVSQPNANGFNVADAPLPVAATGFSAFDLQAQTLYISTQTKHIPACWKWIQFISGTIPPGGSSIPARISIAQSNAFRQHALHNVVELYEVYRPAIEQAQAINSIAALNSLDFYWYYDALTSVVEQRAELSVALEQAQSKTKTFLNCLRQKEKASVCALKVDPNYQGYNLDLPPVPGAG